MGAALMQLGMDRRAGGAPDYTDARARPGVVFSRTGWQNAGRVVRADLGLVKAMAGERLLVISTCPDVDTAERLGRMLVESRLAACVNILPSVRSVFEWRGSLEIGDEVMLLVKTTGERFERLRERLVAEHPYELPEVIGVPIVTGSGAYLEWVDAQVADV
jgi:periplasmic divalent cation tolerance protein